VTGPSGDRDVAGWILRNVLTALTIAGLTTYVAVRLSAVIFYSRLGFTPEEVGLGYVESLSWMMLALLFLAALRVAVKLVVPRGVAALEVLVRRVRRQPGPEYKELKTKYVLASGGLRRLLDLEDLRVTVPIVLAAPIVWALIAAPQAADGQPTSYAPFTPIWRAEAALVHPLSGADVDLGVECVLFVGQADGTFALYDPVTRRALHVPSSAVVIETGGVLDRVAEVPEDCPAPGESIVPS
jgi:hypothetical protein